MENRSSWCDTFFGFILMQFPRGDFLQNLKNDDCDVLAPVVMALFDGEANEAEARRARAHLVVCQICADRWLDWNRARDFLQVAPAPTPPLLMWRVLMACRLAAFARSATASRSATDWKSEFSISAAPRRAPDDLSAKILANTTKSASKQATFRPKKPVFSLLKTPYLVAPALALSLIILQRDQFTASLVAPPLETPVEARLEMQLGAPIPATSRVTAKNIAPESASASRSQWLGARARKTGAVENSNRKLARASDYRPRREPAPPIAENSAIPGARTPFSNAAPIQAPEMRRVSSVSSVSKTPRNLFLASAQFETPVRSRGNGKELRSQFRRERASGADDSASTSAAPRRAFANLPRTATAQTKARPILLALANRTSTNRISTALLAAGRMPALRAARWKNGAALAEQGANQDISSTRAAGIRPPRDAGREATREFTTSGSSQLLRVSLPNPAQPVAARSRLLADNLDGEDARVEEMRSVVDDFRATLISDEAPEDTERPG